MNACITLIDTRKKCYKSEHKEWYKGSVHLYNTFTLLVKTVYEILDRPKCTKNKKQSASLQMQLLFLKTHFIWQIRLVNEFI